MGSVRALLVLSALLVTRSWALSGPSLYSEESKVVRLDDSNLFSSVFNSDKLWIVEFYAHWCGHCQRFAPIWKQVAEQLEPHSASVRVAAINCGTQRSCGKFGILGTPAFHIFLPDSSENNLGERVEARGPVDADFFVNKVLQRLSDLGLHPPSDSAQRQRRGSYGEVSESELKELIFSSHPKHTVLILEPDGQVSKALRDEPDPLSTFGSIVVTGPPFVVKSINNIHTPQSLNKYRDGNNEQGVTALFYSKSIPTIPPVAFVASSLMTAEEKVREIRGFVNPLINMNNAYDSYMNVSDDILEKIQLESRGTNENAEVGEAREWIASEDLEHVSDLERCIQYALHFEIPNLLVLTKFPLQSLHHLLDAIVHHVPLRSSSRHFLMTLRDWLMLNMRRGATTSEEYSRKVKELDKQYQPFVNLSTSMEACAGSEPHLRGYPCSLWVLFHTLTVNAALEDPMNQNSRVIISDVITAYVTTFFSCRHCATNFLAKTNAIGRPRHNNETVIWLWKAHNVANKFLAGDPTEDPAHPKLIWPTEENCPECRPSSEDVLRSGLGNSAAIALIDGQLWHLEKVYDYLIKVYNRRNLVPSVFDEEKFLREQSFETLRTQAKEDNEAAEDIEHFCHAFTSHD